MRTVVHDLRDPYNSRIAVYNLSPREAVRNAYAQFERNDWNTWDYSKYDSLVVETFRTVSCGHQAAFIGEWATKFDS